MVDRTRRQNVIEADPGRGLLSAESYWASVVGPQRLAMAARKAVTLKSTDAVEIYRSLGTSKGYVFVGVALPFNAPTNPLAVVFGKDDQLGFNAGLPIRLTDSLVNWSFTQLILPGEQLYAQIMLAPGAPEVTQNVVVAAAIF